MIELPTTPESKLLKALGRAEFALMDVRNNIKASGLNYWPWLDDEIIAAKHAHIEYQRDRKL
jgi:hypothetical protein